MMNRLVRFPLAALSLSALAMASSFAAAQGKAQPRLPTVRLQAGMHIVQAEHAKDRVTREAGLMWRERLDPNWGMLFEFESPGVHCFWMRNTPLPLSIAFLDDDGRIVNLADMQPRSDDSHCAKRPVRFALEMEQGWFARRGLTVGAQLLQSQVFPSQRARGR